MSRPAVRIQNLGKQYQLGLSRRTFKTLRETIVDVAKSPWRQLRHLSGRVDESSLFWALRNINLEIAPGDVLGIIGHNGSGKSTLLKILSRITEPTTGQIEIDGRVGSLLEVGTGFHPELSGRENVFVNGAILGMSRAVVKRRFDEIVAFSGVEKFLDTPVKRYSSGMLVRLAFAVAAHLEPEILIVDEVLAVGDAEFQNKCLGKMGDVAGSGRTVLLVSHNMAAVESLCRRACLLNAGEIVRVGDVSDVVRQYLDSNCELSGDIDLETHVGRRPGLRPIFRRLRIRNGEGELSPLVRIGGSIRFDLELYSEAPVPARNLAIRVIDSRGLTLFTNGMRDDLKMPLNVEGHLAVSCSINNVRLVPGRYQVRITLKSGRRVFDEIRSDLEFEVLPLRSDGAGAVADSRSGVMIPESEWEFRSEPVNGVVTVAG